MTLVEIKRKEFRADWLSEIIRLAEKAPVFGAQYIDVAKAKEERGQIYDELLAATAIENSPSAS